MKASRPAKPQPQKKTLGERFKNWVYENLIALIMAILIVLVVRSSIVEAFKIPSGSMLPTLYVGDQILVNKYAYGLKLPFTDFLLDQPIYLNDVKRPKRGDVIVFQFPVDPKVYYIKRVVGLPGDTVEIRNKRLYLNGKKIKRISLPKRKTRRILKSINRPRYQRDTIRLYEETFSEGKHTVMLDHDSYINEDYSKTRVPEDQVFVMGDNRDYSNDSRSWGFVPFANIKGKAWVIWMSIHFLTTDEEFIFRANRIGKSLQ